LGMARDFKFGDTYIHIHTYVCINCSFLHLFSVNVIFLLFVS